MIISHFYRCLLNCIIKINYVEFNDGEGDMTR